MMKYIHILLFLSISAFTVSCVDKVESDINRGVDIAALEPMVDFEVPVKEGYTTVVSYAGEQVAVTRSPMAISIPANLTGLEVSYSQDDIFGEFGYAQYWHYLSFEDTRRGDCDYNDVVLHCRIKSDVPWNYTGTQLCKHTVSVQPVALGGSTTVGFGFLYRDATGAIREYIVTDNIRRDLFNNIKSFPINTDLAKPTKKVSNILAPVFECSTTDAKFQVVWFIQNGSDRLYAATTNFNADRNFNMINDEGVPYGIVLTTKWCYPVEHCNIRKAYPGFDAWLRSGDESVLLGQRVGENVYLPATVKNGEDGDLWDYQK